jgi:hypothetical protein
MIYIGRKIGPNGPVFQLNSPNTVINKVKLLLCYLIFFSRDIEYLLKNWTICAYFASAKAFLPKRSLFPKIEADRDLSNIFFDENQLIYVVLSVEHDKNKKYFCFDHFFQFKKLNWPALASFG